MSLFSSATSAAAFATPKIFWLLGGLLAVVVALAVVRAMASGKSGKSGKSGRGMPEPTREAPLSCRVNGHAYGEHDTGWRCATCGNFVPRHEGELYGLVSDGRHERRRRAR